VPWKRCGKFVCSCSKVNSFTFYQIASILHKKLKNYADAMVWYERAAQHGLGLSLYSVGYCILKRKLEGPITPNQRNRNEAGALPWLLRAAKSGLPYARRRCARILFDKTLPFVDWPLAAQLLLKSKTLKGKDLVLFSQRLALPDSERDSLPEQSYRELYVYGKHFACADSNSSLAPNRRNNLNVDVTRVVALYRETTDRAKDAVVALLSVRKVAGSLMARTPRDVCLIVASMVWQSRENPLNWGAGSKGVRRSERLKKRSKK
jgi:hypothetical protein